MTFYGIGTILGAGIYALIGKVAGSAGLLAPLAFLVAAVVAAITALSFCQLVVVFPKSAGTAYYAEKGFKNKSFSKGVGYLVILTGIVSAATLANAFFGYLHTFIELPRLAAVSLVILLMTAIAIWGIAESLWVAAVITVIEVVGLIIVIALSSDSLTSLPEVWPSLFVPTSGGQIMMVLSGAFLAFYAFIGFEDMVNVVEEVKEPNSVMPKAILIAVAICTLLYLLVAVVAVLGLPTQKLMTSNAPLKDLLVTKYPTAGLGIALISLFAIVNGILTQLIMSSRLLYGMARQGNAPAAFANVSPLTRTPITATLVIMLVLLPFALWFPLIILAKLTSFIILIIFTIVNLSLWRLSARNEIPPDMKLPCYPRTGAFLSISLLLLQI